MPSESLGAVLRSLRETADWSQEELAAKAQVSRASIQNWENDRSRPRRAEFRRLAAAFQITADELRARVDGPADQAVAEERPATRAELIGLISDLREEIEYLNPKYERNRPLLVAHLERQIAEAEAALKDLPAGE
jgi:transcriptional regulator with XRE-family HTH domain